MATLNAKETAVTPTHAVVMAPVEPPEDGDWSWFDTAKAVTVVLAAVALILLAPPV